MPLPPRCPNCEFSYGWDGAFCAHCHTPYPARAAWDACTEPLWFDRHYEEAPRRKLALFGCAGVRTVLRFLPSPEAEELVAAVEAAADRGQRVPKSVFDAARRLRERVHAETLTTAPARSAADALAQLAEAAAGATTLTFFHAGNSAVTATALAAVPETPDERTARPVFLDDPTRPRASGYLWDVPSDLTDAEREKWELWQAAMTRAGQVRTNRLAATKTATAALCDLYRDIVAYPFEPVAFDPAWRTGAATALARSMRDSRDFSHLPILADALQDAGCEDEHVLAHCRDPKGGHVLGCWVIDAVLE
jgi:hypothetical protein